MRSAGFTAFFFWRRRRWAGTGDVSGVGIGSLLVPTSLGSLCLCPVYSLHPPPGWGSPEPRAQRRVSDRRVNALRRNPDSALCWVVSSLSPLTAFPSFLRSPSSLTSNCLCLLFGTQGGLKPSSYKPDSGAFVPERPCRVLPAVISGPLGTSVWIWVAIWYHFPSAWRTHFHTYCRSASRRFSQGLFILKGVFMDYDALGSFPPAL